MSRDIDIKPLSVKIKFKIAKISPPTTGAGIQNFSKIETLDFINTPM